MAKTTKAKPRPKVPGKTREQQAADDHKKARRDLNKALREQNRR